MSRTIKTHIREKFAKEYGNNMVPLHEVEGFYIRPGYYLENGATVLPGGISFTVHTQKGTAVTLLLFKRHEEEPYAKIPFPEDYKIGDVYSMIVFDLDYREFEYAYRVEGPFNPKKGYIFDGRQNLLDPYANAVAGQRIWGAEKKKEHYHGRVTSSDFDWGKDKQPNIDMKDMIIYELHVRGFTIMEDQDRVKNPGTFSGLIDKIPYLKSLGINTVELMPVFEFDERSENRSYKGKELLNYWGYNPVAFFAPNTAYSAEVEHNREGEELKTLIKEMHKNGIQVFLDVVYNHTAEGNEDGLFFSFKGFDNHIYYMLDENGHYANYSGTGNTLNANHPVVQNFIMESMRYWVTEYHIDGFRFDLASILGRDEYGKPLENPPLIKELAYDPLLSKVKLIAEAWDAGGLYQVGSFPDFERWSEWNGKYRDDIRRFLKGDMGMANAAAIRIAGSIDIYDPEIRDDASINFITCHDGFTLHDLYSYNEKHNEANGWDNTDGENNNNSWNCGVEGETEDPKVIALRRRMVRNAFTILLLSRGTPMILAGDEFGNSQKGNNNPYCQDNEISWLNWKDLEKNRDLYYFVRKLILFRKKHPVLKVGAYGSCKFYDNWGPVEQFREIDRYIGIRFSGVLDDRDTEDIIFLAANMYWEDIPINLPEPPVGCKWKLRIDTSGEKGQDIGYFLEKYIENNKIEVPGRSIMVFTAWKA